MDSTILNGVLPLAGVIVGTVGTYLIQSKLFKKQREWEEQMSRKIEIQKKDQQKFVIYNQVLKLDGESMIVEYYPHFLPKFIIENYQETIRPVLFEHLHLLDQEVADVVLKIDYKIKECNSYEEVLENDHEILVSNYEGVISNIKESINNFAKDSLISFP